MFGCGSLVNPIVCRKNEFPGIIVIVVATKLDFDLLKSLSVFRILFEKKLYMSNFCVFENEFGLRYGLVGPILGAPYAVVILETLCFWGVEDIIFVGWCGSIFEGLKFGDIIVPNSAIIDEGTSGNYGVNVGSLVMPSDELTEKIKNMLNKYNLFFKSGCVWTTDAIFRENSRKIEYFQKKGAIAVEMELSAMFSVASFRGVNLASIIVVSDELYGVKWSPGFKSKFFNRTRKSVCSVINSLSSELLL